MLKRRDFHPPPESATCSGIGIYVTSTDVLHFQRGPHTQPTMERRQPLVTLRTLC
jgi:hypothetical protein